MPISRMQMPRQLRRGGGIMEVAPRQGALLGGLKKAVKGVAKGIGSVLKSDLGKAALIGGGLFGIPGTSFGGLLGRGEGSFLSNLFSGKATGLKELLGGEKTLGKTLGVVAGGTVLGGVLGSLSPEEEEEVSSGRNIEALRGKLTTAYQNLGYDESKIPALVENDLSEYTQDMARGMANGGRIGYSDGTEFEKYLKGKEEFDKKRNAEELYKEFLENKRRQKVAEQKTMAANGGRIGYAMGTDQIVNQASGIMGLPQRTNKAGVKELDLRESGGFIPPVGIKEKADDIPAMLSNNEFVFTADAVRGMGDGNVNTGAQRMYDMMKKLEKGGRV
jgi:PPE-repeat protein